MPRDKLREPDSHMTLILGLSDREFKITMKNTAKALGGKSRQYSLSNESFQQKGKL